MFRQAALYLCSMILLTHAPGVVSVFCTGGSAIDIQASEKRAFSCPGTTFGQVRMYWETANTNAEGFSEDEYFINVLDDSALVYREGQFSAAAFSSSGLLGSTDGGDNWVVQFECNLEFSFLNCEDGTFNFALVDCGCPEGEGVVEACSVSSLDGAKDAVCAPTPSPTPAPPTTAAPSTAEPTAPPSLRPTPQPTSAPVSSPTPAATPGFCFSGETTVHVQGKAEPIPMKELQIGDHVLTQSKTYQPVYAFAHKDTLRTIDFLQIHTTSKTLAPLEMTEEHMIYVEGKTAPIRAGALNVGDILSTVTSSADSEAQTVNRISRVSRQGLFAPLTQDGTIVVADGIVASNYIAMQESRGDMVKTNEQVVLSNNWTVVFLHQADMAHIWLSPMRLWCLGVTSKMCDLRDEDGKHPYVALGLHFANVMDSKPLPIQLIALVLTVLIMGIFAVVELCFGAAYGPLAVLFMASIAISNKGFCLGTGKHKKVTS